MTKKEFERLQSEKEISRLQADNERILSKIPTISSPKCAVYVTLPFPPSVNDYWGRGRRGNFFLKSAAKTYKKDVAMILALSGMWSGDPIADKIGLDIISHKSDARRYDIDNLLKALLDSMKGVVFVDDYNVDKITIERGAIDRENPRVEVKLTAL